MNSPIETTDKYKFLADSIYEILVSMDKSTEIGAAFNSLSLSDRKLTLKELRVIARLSATYIIDIRKNMGRDLSVEEGLYLTQRAFEMALAKYNEEING